MKDVLTERYNRRTRHADPATPFSVAFDGLKAVNEGQGHGAVGAAKYVAKRRRKTPAFANESPDS